VGHDPKKARAIVYRSLSDVREHPAAESAPGLGFQGPEVDPNALPAIL
jgi:hypothetical protein